MAETNGNSIKIPNWLGQVIVGFLLTVLFSLSVAVQARVNEVERTVARQEAHWQDVQSRLERIESKLDAQR